MLFIAFMVVHIVWIEVFPIFQAIIIYYYSARSSKFPPRKIIHLLTWLSCMKCIMVFGFYVYMMININHSVGFLSTGGKLLNDNGLIGVGVLFLLVLAILQFVQFGLCLYTNQLSNKADIFRVKTVPASPNSSIDNSKNIFGNMRTIVMPSPGRGLVENDNMPRTGCET